MELTPREVEAAPDRPGRSRLTYLAITVVVLALGFVVVQGLSNATTFFYNADEAVERRADTGDRRFRLQGAVVEGSVSSVAEEVSFQVAHAGVVVDVRHVGDPPELFQEGIPVVLEGRWSEADPTVFASDRILVKHSEEYVEDNGERVDTYVGQDGSSETDAP